MHEKLPPGGSKVGNIPPVTNTAMKEEAKTREMGRENAGKRDLNFYFEGVLVELQG